MSKFKKGNEVIITGESIGGFDYKYHKGIINSELGWGHYKVSVNNTEITYTENKLEHYDNDLIIKLLNSEKINIQNKLNELMK